MATTARFTDNIGVFHSGTDNTDRTLNNQYLTPAFASTITVNPYAAYTLVAPATLTGICTINAGVGGAGVAPFVGDKLQFLLVSDGTSRVVTFGTGFLSTGTLSVTTAKTANIQFIFNGTNWCETGRTVTA